MNLNLFYDFVSNNFWLLATFIYIFLAIMTLFPTLKAVFRRIKLHDGGESFETNSHFTSDESQLLTQHFTRIKGTLLFWKNEAEKYRSFHYYCLFWTIPISILIPITTQAISGDTASKFFLTIMSTHAAILLSFHKGFKIENNFKAFRHGESEFYDTYRRLLDTPQCFGNTNQEQIETYFRQIEQVRKFVRNSETDNFPTIEEVSEQLRKLYANRNDKTL